MDEATVAARVNNTLFVRRFDDVVNRVVVLATRTFVGERAAAESLLGRVVAGQIGADNLPIEATVRSFEQHIGRVINHSCVMR